jgi:hypothetical protein
MSASRSSDLRALLLRTCIEKGDKQPSAISQYNLLGETRGLNDAFCASRNVSLGGIPRTEGYLQPMEAAKQSPRGRGFRSGLPRTRSRSACRPRRWSRRPLSEGADISRAAAKGWYYLAISGAQRGKKRSPVR